MLDSTLLNLNSVQRKILRTISEIYYSSLCNSSTLKRSISLTELELTYQFPDYLRHEVIRVINVMTTHHLLMIKYDENNSIEYCINPNKIDDSENTFKNILELEDCHEPIEERLRGYTKVFSTEGKNLIQGKKSTYDYYQRVNSDRTFELDFYVVITGKNESIRITKIGNIKDPLSLGGSILAIVIKMPSTFTKVDIEQRIPRVLLKNRQPLRAVLDILIHLNIIESTGKKINRSEEFRKINSTLNMSTLDDF